MRNKIFKIVSCVVFFIFFLCAFESFVSAQQQSEFDKLLGKYTGTKLQQRSKEALKIQKLVGKWIGEVLYTFSDGKKKKVKAVFSAKSIAEKTGIYLKINDEFHGLLGYDVFKDSLYLLSLLQMVTYMDGIKVNGVEVVNYSGWWKDDKTLELKWVGETDDKKKFIKQVIFAFNFEKNLSIKVNWTIADKLFFSMEGNFKK